MPRRARRRKALRTPPAPMTERPDPAHFVEILAPALRQAASIARALEGRVANRPKRHEATPTKAALTVADTASQEALLVPLLEQFPEVCLAAEEDTPTVARFPVHGDDVVVIDPIDGTLRFYLENQGPYAVMIGLVQNGIYRAALVALPREELFFAAFRDGGARRVADEGPSQPIRVSNSGRRVLVSHDLPEPARARLLDRGLEPVPASGGAIAVAPLLPGVCAGLRLANAEPPGVSIRGRIGALIAREAGALLRCEGGGSFPLDLTTPARALLVAADADGLGALEEALAAAGL